MRKRIAFYISGHGLGHAGRAVAVLQALLAAREDVEVEVRTDAPHSMFAAVAGLRISLHPGLLDPGMAEFDSLTIDAERTIRRLRAACAEYPAHVEREARTLRERGVQLLLADVPFLTGYVAERLEIPCLAISNFTWDWIYEPLLADAPDRQALLEWVRGGYRRMSVLVRLPFGGSAESFPEVVDVPFLARSRAGSGSEVEARLGLAPDDPRQRVLPAVRGGTAAAAIEKAAADCPECLFLSPHPRASGSPTNLVPVPEAAFDDLLLACDVVLSKPGWGIFNDCVILGKALLWTPRHGFREDDLTTAGMPRYLRMRRLSRDQYEQGDWAENLRGLLRQPPPPETPRTDGAALCADQISRWL